MNREVLRHLLWFSTYLLCSIADLLLAFTKTGTTGFVFIILFAFSSMMAYRNQKKAVEYWDSHLADKINFEQKY